MTRGLAVILTGASSVGKSNIRERLLKDPDLDLFYSTSVTTRPKRPDEVDGKDYYFITFKEFAESVKKHELLEYTEFNGWYYGTPKAQVEFLLEKGKNVLLEVEAQGVGPLKLNLPDALAVFVMPKSYEDLAAQVEKTYGDDEASAKRRLNKAKMEMELAPLFKHVVTNEDPDRASAEIKKAILEELKKRKDASDQEETEVPEI